MAVQIAIYRKERSALIDHNISMIDYKPKWKKSQEWQKKAQKSAVFVCCPMSTYGGARSVQIKICTAPP